MHQKLGREPTPEELAVELDRTPDQIEELLRTSRQPISLDSTIGEDGETSIGDLIEDVDAPEASELVDRQLMADQLRHALDALTPREATIMAMRFGLYDGNPHTLDEIGRALGLTRERIRQAIQRGFADSARTIRLPVHVLEMLSKLSRVERDMHQRLGREPTPEELAVELDRTPDQIEELLRTSRQPISLDSTIGEDGETSIGDLIEDTDAPEASEMVDRQLMAEQLRSALDALTPREATIMSMRFGLYDGNPHTLDEIGRALGLTRERIRQLEKQSLSKLRHPSRAQPLLDFAS
jgi:DNA-directed RNA polymerase sigma subunit (sigma70/sigma32)